MYEGMMAESIRLPGHDDDEIAGYFARPLGPGPFPGVVVIHHMPGFDQGSKEITRTFAVHGYAAICPNLHYREAPDASPDDAAAAARAAGGVPDERCIGDVAGSMRYLRSLPYANGKVGVIGYCSGGRQTYIVACNLPVDAAVDCYGGRVVAAADELTARQPVAPLDMTADLRCPLLGLFGVEDQNPSPDHVALIRAELDKHAKTYQFHSYDGAGHGFFSVDRPGYRVAAATDGWQRIWSWFGDYLTTPS
ncbi:MAG TPA: dienelactone hydrolase family protein [Acidimicrobiales bacterium]|nr:dienelactone hydrolase family protein [Acidimicrobiales bacterium]